MQHYDLSSLKAIVCGAAPLQSGLDKQLREKMAPAVILPGKQGVHRRMVLVVNFFEFLKLFFFCLVVTRHSAPVEETSRSGNGCILVVYSNFNPICYQI